MTGAAIISNPVFIAIFLVVAGTAGLIYFSVVLSRRNTQRMRSFLEHSGLALPVAGELGTGTENGIEYRYQYLVAGRGQRPEFRLWYPHRNRGQASVRRERSGDRFFKQLGLVAEVQTKDRKFDAAYFIDSAEPAFARALFANEAARGAIETIMACGFDKVILDGESISARLTRPDGVRRPHRRLQEAIQSLHRLGEDQPRVPDHLGRDRRVSWRFRLGVVYSILALTAAAGVGLVFFGLAYFRPLDTGPLFAHSLLYSLPACALAWVLLVLALRGRSDSHIHFGISAPIAVVALLFLGDGLFMFANAYTDRSAAALHRADVIGKRISRSKNGTTYRVRVRSWRPGVTQEEFKVPRMLYQSVEAERDRLDITTRSGRFGYEWLSAPPALTAREEQTLNPATKRINDD